MNIRMMLEPRDEGGYSACVPCLPGGLSEAEDLQQALANIQEAIGLYLEPIPEGDA